MSLTDKKEITFLKDRVASIAVTTVRKYLAKTEWLFHPSEIHGIDHMERVLRLQEFVADALEQDGVVLNREALRWAAGFHDVARIDDGLDSDHGRRSGEWIRANMQAVIPPEILEMVIHFVTCHNIEDDHIPNMTNELAVLKDADALDRVRINDLDPTRLRFAVSKTLVSTAEKLLENSLRSRATSID